VRNGLVPQAGNQRQRNGQIRRRFIQPQTADYVDIRVQIGEKVTAPFFQHRQNQRHAVVVKSSGRTPRIAERRLAHQPLHLRQHRT